MSENLVSLANFKEKKEGETRAVGQGSEAPMSESEYFLEVERKNKALRDKMEKDRLRANKSVLRSYKIKS